MVSLLSYFCQSINMSFDFIYSSTTLQLADVLDELQSLSSKRFHICIRLGLPLNELQNIDKKHQDDHILAFAGMLDKRMRDGDGDLTWLHIVTALESPSVGQGENYKRAAEIRKKYGLEPVKSQEPEKEPTGHASKCYVNNSHTQAAIMAIISFDTSYPGCEPSLQIESLTTGNSIPPEMKRRASEPATMSHSSPEEGKSEPQYSIHQKKDITSCS